MKEPYTWVVGAEAKHDMAVGLHEDRVTAHGGGGGCRCVCGIVGAGVLGAAGYELEGVAVEMEGMPDGCALGLA